MVFVLFTMWRLNKWKLPIIKNHVYCSYKIQNYTLHITSVLAVALKYHHLEQEQLKFLQYKIRTIQQSSKSSLLYSLALIRTNYPENS